MLRLSVCLDKRHLWAYNRHTAPAHKEGTQ